LYGNLQGVEAGLDQGGTTGLLSAGVSAYGAYQNAGQLLAVYNSIFGASGAVSTSVGAIVAASNAVASAGVQAAAAATTAATASAAALGASAGAAAGVTAVTGTANAVAAANIVASQGVAAGTVGSGVGAGAGAGAGGTGAVGAIGAVAAPIIAGLIVDHAFNDGRVTNGFNREFEIRSEGVKALFDGDFSTFRKSFIEGPIESLKETFGGRDFDQILAEDFLPELLGNTAEGFSALGADGGTGFAGGNQAVFGSNFGIEGTGLSAQLLTDGGENGNGGFFTGAQSSLDAFQEMAEAAGFTVQAANGVIEVLSDTQTTDDIKALWQEYSDGLENSIEFSEVFATAIDNNLIQPSNLFFENFAVGFAQNADEARNSLITIDEEFDKLVAGGADSTDALIKSFSNFYGISEEQAVEFVARSGVEIDKWVSNFTNASNENLAALLDFRADGTTAFKEIQEAGSSAALGIQDAFVGELSGVLSGINLGSFNIPPVNVQVNTPSPSRPPAPGQGGQPPQPGQGQPPAAPPVQRASELSELVAVVRENNTLQRKNLVATRGS